MTHLFPYLFKSILNSAFSASLSLSLFFYFILFLLLFRLSRFDIKYLRIPNFFLSQYLFLLLLGFLLSIPEFHVSFLFRLLGFILLPLVLLIFASFFPGGIGGGDIKFLALTGFFFGIWFQIYAVFFALLSALIFYFVSRILSLSISHFSRSSLFNEKTTFLCANLRRTSSLNTNQNWSTGPIIDMPGKKRKEPKAFLALGPFLSFGILFQILLQNIYHIL